MIEFKSISKRFKNVTVLKNLDLKINKGELVSIIGESGCGKTTLLKMINRLIEPSSGTILIKGNNIKKQNVIQLRRNIGYVIQQTGLFPHMTVKQNIELIPKIENIDPKKLEKNTLNLMSMIGLEPDKFLNRYPTELSGGQQQRIGVARAFATDPEIILMDEPFSALDPLTRSDLQDELIELQSKLKKTIVFVTHDMDEAIKISDRICIMKNGKILQYDTPENILKSPADSYVENFVGKNRIWTSPEFIKVKDIMIEQPVVASIDSTIIGCLEVMRSRKIDRILIIDLPTKKLKGIVRASKLRKEENKTKRISENPRLMDTDFITLSPEENIINTLKIVDENHISTIPVVDENFILKGLLTKSSLVTTLSQQYLDMEVE
ncbi:betaine/proline/choline family ABC transporter ATP-binding protein [Fusobacterium sp. MFO224]|uniref:betaine/proline/choline family ABC transporter ATP-binding protein n=1 Tax=Fusobacterium sp. MFO224 TaxID=3378070 RepID=UPI003854932A